MNAIRYYTDDFDQSMLDFIEKQLDMSGDGREWDSTDEHLVYSSDMGFYWTCRLQDPDWYEYLTKQQFKEKIGMTTKTFTKADLKDGMVVRTKDGGYGDHYLVIGSKLLGNGHCNLESFEEDLRCTRNSDFDIMEVYSVRTNGGVYNLKDLLIPRNLKSIWKRPEKSESQIQLEKLQQQIAELQEQANKLKDTL